MEPNVISRPLSVCKRFKSADVDLEPPTNDLVLHFNPNFSHSSIITPLLFLFIIISPLYLIILYLFFIDFFLIIKFQCRIYLLQLRKYYVNVGTLWKWRPYGRNPILDVGSFVAKFQRYIKFIFLSNIVKNHLIYSSIFFFNFVGTRWMWIFSMVWWWSVCSS